MYIHHLTDSSFPCYEIRRVRPYSLRFHNKFVTQNKEQIQRDPNIRSHKIARIPLIILAFVVRTVLPLELLYHILAQVSGKLEGAYLEYGHQNAKYKRRPGSECSQWSMVWEIMLTIDALSFDTLTSIKEGKISDLQEPEMGNQD